MKDHPTDPLRQALVRHSPRYAGARSTWRAALIHLTVTLLWGWLLHEAWMPTSMSMAWSLGIAYVTYDTLLLVFVACWSWRILWPAPERPAAALTDRPPSVAVIVAAHNEAAALPVTIQALLNQSDHPEQIVVADDGSCDDTASLMTRRWGIPAPDIGELSAASPLHPNLHWLRLPHGGKARALNTALTRVNTQVVLTVDGDTVLETDAIAAVRSAFHRRPALVAATGVITPVCRRDIQGRILQWFQTYEYLRNFLSRYAWARLNCLLLVSGAFACFRREAVLEVGGFDGECLVEDYELIHRLQRHARDQGLGWRVDVLGDARARTDAPSDIPAFLRQRRRWFGGFLQTQYWYRDMVAQPRMGALGLLMLPVKALDTLQPIYGLTAFALLLFFAATGQSSLVATVFGIMGIKIAIDLVYHLWSVYLYRRWVGPSCPVHYGHALLASVAEPLTFQLLRHLGALLGWWTALRGSGQWGHTGRRSVGEHPASTSPRLEEGESPVRAS